MTVAPKHQYRGAGTLLCKWGTELADRIGVDVSLTVARQKIWNANKVFKSVYV